MSDRGAKELRKMRRNELIEIIYALQQNEMAIRKEMDEIQKQLDEKVIAIEKAGSIAEASLNVNKVFETVQAAADQYLISAKAEADRIIEEARREAEKIKNQTTEEGI